MSIDRLKIKLEAQSNEQVDATATTDDTGVVIGAKIIIQFVCKSISAQPIRNSRHCRGLGCGLRVGASLASPLSADDLHTKNKSA